jgi:DNA-binding NarL/FixJ family response regulator
VRTVRVAVVHREALAAEGIAAALGRHGRLLPVGIADSTRRADAATAGADVVVLDHRLSGAEELAVRLRRRGARVVLLSDRPATDGDEGFRVPTSATLETLALTLVPQAVAVPPSPLTEQQRRVLALAARGLTAREIAREMEISPKTVEQHKSKIFRKLGVPNQAAAVRVALTAGLEGSLA